MQVTIEQAREAALSFAATRRENVVRVPEVPCPVVMGVTRNAPEGTLSTCRKCGTWVVRNGMPARF